MLSALVARLAALEERVQRQEQELVVLRQRAGESTRVEPRPAASTSSSETPAPPISYVGETADSWVESHAPMLTLRGFGDVQYRWRRGPAKSNAFTVGQIDLFITSKITDELHLLNENVAKVGSNGSAEFEAERLLIRYSPSDYFNISAGRFHTAIGFYNTAFHHGSWFQTSIGRPIPFRPETQGGILPIHNVGLSINGQVPGNAASRAGLNYTFELGNGRSYRSVALPVQQTNDANSQKALNFALVSRPEALPGFQAGVSFYTDRPTTATGAIVRQDILALHAVVQRPSFEWLNEVIVMRNDPAAPGPTKESWGFYSQFGRSFGALRPYARYQLLDIAAADPVLSAITASGKSHGPSIGLRYNLSNFTALKLQYDRLRIENSPATSNDLTFQWAFTF